MKKQEYYRLVTNYKPYLCSSITYTVAISEPYELFLQRNLEYRRGESATITLVLVQPCTEEEYRTYRKFNPTNESYLKLQKQDYSKFLKGE